MFEFDVKSDHQPAGHQRATATLGGVADPSVTAGELRDLSDRARSLLRENGVAVVECCMFPGRDYTRLHLVFEAEVMNVATTLTTIQQVLDSQFLPLLEGVVLPVPAN